MNDRKFKLLSTTDYVLRFLTLIVGFVFLFSGFVKAVDPMGTTIKIQDYLSSFGWEFAKPYSDFLSFLLFSTEFVVGGALVFRIFPKFFHRFALLIMLFMTPLSLYLYIANPISDCGCFGDAIKLTNGETLAKNLVLLVFVLLILKRSFLEHLGVRKLFSSLTLFILVAWIVGFGYYNQSNLPMFDFRPYKVGANIMKMKQLPEGARPDEYDYGFIYSKDGEERRFTLDNYPAKDSSWTFVRNDSELIRAGDHAIAEDFLFFSPNGEEKSDSLLSLRTPLFVVVSHDLQESNVEIGELRRLVAFAWGIGSGIVLASAAEHPQNLDWMREKEINIPDFFGDKVLLKTIIRSNPGYLLLHEGTIVGKWHAGKLPKDEDLNQILKRMRGETIKKQGVNSSLLLAVGGLVVLIGLIYWIVRNRSRHRNPRKINRYY